MLETLLDRTFFLNRHQKAPLLTEREVFLLHLQEQGISRAALRNLSGELIHVVRLLRLKKLHDISQEEIQQPKAGRVHQRGETHHEPAIHARNAQAGRRR